LSPTTFLLNAERAASPGAKPQCHYDDERRSLASAATTSLRAADVADVHARSSVSGWLTISVIS
jgi:hypothetical protein